MRALSIFLAAIFLWLPAQAEDRVIDRQPDALTPEPGRFAKKGETGERMTEAEIEALPRDERRTKYIEGFSCSRYIQGQVGFLRYEEGGVGYFGHQEDDVKFTWWVRDDKYCLKLPNRVEPRCVDFPARDVPNERAEITKWLQRSCI